MLSEQEIKKLGEQSYENRFRCRLLGVLRTEYAGKRFCIWGAGKNGQKIAAVLNQNSIEFIFVDKNPNLHGTDVLGNKVESWDNAKALVDVILVSSSVFYEEVVSQTQTYIAIDVQKTFIGNNPNVNLRLLEEETKTDKLEEIMNDFYEEISAVNYFEDSDRLDEQLQQHMLLYRARPRPVDEFRPGIWYESNVYRHQDVLTNYAGMRAFQYWEYTPVRVFHGEAFHKRDALLHEGSYVCFGASMKDEIRRVYPKNVILPVGAYIHYADGYYDEKRLTEYKNKLGRNLLVFPMHSIEFYSVHFNENDFVSFVFEEAKKFDSLSICVRAEDINNEYVNMFRKAGANIVSAGIRFDKHYLPRQKTMIQAADAVLTNSIGAHVVYALAENCPVKYFRQATRRYYSNTKTDFVEDTDENLMSVLESSSYLINKEIIEAYEPFIGSGYWRSPSEIAAYYDLCYDIWREADYLVSRFEKASIAVYNRLIDTESANNSIKVRLLKEAIS